jgi:amino acid permease
MADLGTGVIILIVVWVITLALLTLFTFVQSPVRFIGLIALILAVIITLVLTLLPRGNANQSSQSNQIPYSYAGLARILILTFLCVTFLVGLVLVFIYEVVPPIFGQPIRKRFVR